MPWPVAMAVAVDTNLNAVCEPEDFTLFSIRVLSTAETI